MKHEIKPLIEEIPYRQRVWITGFLKTTISSGLIATGIVSIFAGIIDHPLLKGYHEIGILVGATSIGLSIILITFIDHYDEKKKKEELEIIDSKIEDKAEEVARKLVDKELEKILEECK
ncbi:MAG: hypothetical protein ISP01_07190 [Methanobrevibacter arboriphilus]|uniref:Uncharacterized protein n=1 Tax=Methanobrevibacter arboriphilus TaxID=39441 RepID=A0A843AJF1_METAZ|nr:hypothetical protein [Methanobrevibacter arboriphilus]MBF4469175.1 hypothetical protein [Methanobrevibacter arboriphilus]